MTYSCPLNVFGQNHCTIVFVNLFAFAAADKNHHVAGAGGVLFPRVGGLTTTGMVLGTSLERY